MNKQKYTIGIIIVGAVLLGMLYFNSTPVSMARDCRDIQVGQSLESVENQLMKYLNEKKVEVNRGGAGSIPLVPPIEYDQSLGLYALSLIDDFQCNVFFKEDEVVHIEVIAD